MRAGDNPLELQYEVVINRVVARVEDLNRLFATRDQDSEERDFLFVVRGDEDALAAYAASETCRRTTRA